MTLDEALDTASGTSVPECIYDVLLRTGVAGDGFGWYPGGISLDSLKNNLPALNFGPMKAERMPQAINTPDRKLALAAAILMQDIDRLESAIAEGFYSGKHLMLIGRRHWHSNNSWMHNLKNLAKGPDRCTALINPADAERLGIVSGDRVEVSSRIGAITIIADVSDAIAVGAVSIPHGFSEWQQRSQLNFAHGLRGANVNLLHDDAAADRPSGGASFNATHVRLERIACPVGG